MEENKIAYKFVQHGISPLENYKNSFEYQTKVKLLRREVLSRQEKNKLTERLSTSRPKTQLRLMGWAFDFSNLLTEYWVEFNHGDIFRYWACDKTSLRNCLSSVNRIVEVTKPELNS